MKFCPAAPDVGWLSDGLPCSVIMVDEAHERSLSTDLLLGLLRKVVAQRPNLRILISSASLEVGLPYILQVVLRSRAWTSNACLSQRPHAASRMEHSLIIDCAAFARSRMANTTLFQVLLRSSSLYLLVLMHVVSCS